MKTLPLFLILFCSTVIASGEATWKYVPTTVNKIVIKENASIDDRSSGAGQEDCGQYRLTTMLVKSYFKKARSIESAHDYQWSGCKATGTVEFTNGDHGTWQINSSRLGFLTLSDGRSFAFFCRDTDCKDEPYANWRGINSDSEFERESQ
jgi:hypothetical protein